MFKRFVPFVAVLMIGILVSCKGSDAFKGTTTSSVTDPGVASIELLASTLAMGSGSAADITFTALVKDANNNLMEDVGVVFQANDGNLQVISNTTNASGQATAVLTNGSNPANRTITVTATAGTQTVSMDVDVSGTLITMNGDAAVVLGSPTTITVFLKDSEGAGIPNKTIAVSSAKSNTLSATSLTTDSSGRATFDVTGIFSGADTITASALGASASFSINVSPDEFSVTIAQAEMNIGTPYIVAATWKKNGVPVANGTQIKFSATRGTLSASSSLTVNGVAAVTINSNSAGPTTITASGTAVTDPSGSAQAEFVAITPAQITLQSDKSTIGPNGQQATLTATVWDTNNNLVKNKKINFYIVQDTSGGSLSNATATTDSNGRASTVYTSSLSTTAKDGVQIKAEVDEDKTKTVIASITVAQAALYVRLGASHLLQSLDDTRYKKQYAALVTDAAGNPQVGKNVVINIIPTRYAKGIRCAKGICPSEADAPDFYAVRTDPWGVICKNEDMMLPSTSPDYLNGILDAGEEERPDGVLTPGNQASAPGVVTTDQYGSAIINIVYAKDMADWVEVELQASVSVAGTESIDKAVFWLPASSADIKPPNVAHPGDISPFGTSNVCDVFD